MDAPHPLLMIMARAPERGRVKLRLQSILGPEAALRLHIAMLEDTMGLARRTAVRFREILVCWGSDQELPPPPHWVRRHPEFRHMAQGGGGLGQRLSRAFLRELRAGAVICVGSDSPTLPDEYLLNAVRSIGGSAPQAVFGPARDGGYYLVGLSTFVPSLFEGIDWGTERVLAQSLEQAERDGVTVTLLPTWYDLDRPEDLRLLLDSPNPDAGCGPRTTEVARRLLEGALS